ncbi:MAG: DUF3288 family protein [Synechococcus sp.]|nr:DUF3288 family protein [Synechococcus sp.]
MEPSSNDQNHPLHATDRDLVDRLLAAEQPADDHLVDAARLLMRYEKFPGAHDLSADLAKALRLWGLSRQQLHSRTRAIWEAGFRPLQAASSGGGGSVGSSFDTSDQEQS